MRGDEQNAHLREFSVAQSDRLVTTLNLRRDGVDRGGTLVLSEMTQDIADNGAVNVVDVGGVAHKFPPKLLKYPLQFRKSVV